MVKEMELKVTDINKDEVVKRLKSLDAKYVDTYMYRRIISIPKQNGRGESWFRIRSDGKKHVVTFKQKNGSRLAQDKYEMQIADIGEYAKIFMDAPYKILYFENKRVEYNLDGNKITIDKWPYLPWSLEIEGGSKKEIMEMFRRLALKKGRPLGNMSGRKGYSHHGLDYEKIGTKNLKKIKNLINLQSYKI